MECEASHKSGSAASPEGPSDLQLPDQAPSVLEYSELPSDYSYASQYANIMNHVLSLAYLERVAGYMEKLDVEVVPYHIAIKAEASMTTRTRQISPCPSPLSIR